MSLKNTIGGVYDKQYKKLLFIPILLLIFGIAQIGMQVASTGDFVNKGVTLKGGSTVTVFHNADSVSIQSFLEQDFADDEVSVRSLTRSGQVIGFSVESSIQSQESLSQLTAALESYTGVNADTYTVEVTGATIGNSFFKQMLIAMVIAFVLMATVVFIYFRTLVPSLAVVLAAVSDIIVTLAIFNLTGMKLNTAGVAAFLMLIGYSVDTDILLTSRLLKEQGGTVFGRIVGALKTGMTMSLSTLAAVTIGLFITNSAIVKQIMIILFIGLVVDIINTWIQNAAIMRMYMEKKHGNN